MATLGFEVCRDDHLENSTRSGRDRGQRNVRSNDGRSQHSVSSSSGRQRLRDYLGSSQTNSAASVYSGRYDDDRTASSFFSDDTSEATSDSTRRRRKRKCAVWMMAIYMMVAAITFFTVLLWRMGLIFNRVDESLNSLQGFTDKDGYDDEGRMICNGLALNCFRRANEIMYATVHNAMSSRDDGFLAYNNLFSLEDALMAGFRGLTIDSCDCTRVGIQLCHGLCLAGFRRPLPAFSAIVDFLTKYTHEVVIVEIQVGEESLGPLFNILQEVSGLADLMYQHPGEDEPWPKLKDMIELNKRLIIFAHDDLGCEEAGLCPAGVHSTFDYAFETPFDQRSVAQLMNVEETCSVSRGWSNSDFVISNHFLTNERGLPDIELSAIANTAENLQARLDACQDKFSNEYGQEVINLLVVDFWNVGDTLSVVHKYNSQLPPKTEAPSEAPTSAPTVSPVPTTQPEISVKDTLVSPVPSTFSPTTQMPISSTMLPTITVESMLEGENNTTTDTAAPLVPEATSSAPANPSTTTSPTLELANEDPSDPITTLSPTAEYLADTSPSNGNQVTLLPSKEVTTLPNEEATSSPTETTTESQVVEEEREDSNSHSIVLVEKETNP